MPFLVAVTMVATLVATVSAHADQRYEVNGSDVYRVGPAGITTRIVYTGTQLLSIDREGDRTRYVADARYTRNAEDGKESTDARFVQELLPSGSFEDRVDRDPDFLTVLNQPFAVQLDRATMRDLRLLHGAVPFNATSPLGGEAVLRGFLRPGHNGEIRGRPVVAVRFEAEGPMSGSLPEHSIAAMTGRMRMDGTAYYAQDSALLLALDATLTIAAQLHDGQQVVPVKIVYRRYIRAAG